MNSDIPVSKWIYYSIQTKYFSNLACISSSSKMPRAGWDYIKNEIAYYPKKQDEVIKICKISDSIESKIETQIKIIESYNSLINVIKEKIIKEIQGNSRKLKDILIEHKDYAMKDDTYIHVTLSKEGIYEKNDRYDRDFLVKNEDKQYKISNYNDICYNPANLKFGVITINKFGDCIFSPIYVTFKVKKQYNPDYVAQYLCRPNFIKKARKYEQGTVYERMSVSPDDLLSIPIIIPNIDTQRRINNQLKSFELKIKLEVDILEQLISQKNYLLNNLFI